MDWFLLAFLPPLFFSMSVIIDQFMARDFFKDSAIAFQTTACLLCIPLALIVFCLNGFAIEWNITLIIGAFMAKWCYMAGVIPYTLGIQRDDASVCAPIFQVIPVIILLFGYLFLQETVGLRDLVACFVVVFGSMLTSWDTHHKKFRYLTALYILLFAVACAVFTIILRFLALEFEWLDIFLWLLVASITGGILELVFLKRVREVSFDVIKKTRGKVFVWNALQEFLDQGGIAAKTAVLAIAPTAAHAATVNAVQPIYILVLGGLFSIIRPDLFDKPKRDGELYIKVISVVIIFVGLYLLAT